MSAGTLIAIAVGAAVLLVLSFLFGSIPLVWYAAGAVCLFTGLVGPGIACLVVGVLLHVFRFSRRAFRR
jgi:hypothetical protein